MHYKLSKQVFTDKNPKYLGKIAKVRKQEKLFIVKWEKTTPSLPIAEHQEEQSIDFAKLTSDK